MTRSARNSPLPADADRAWKALAAHAAEPAPTSSPQWLSAALTHLPAGRRPRILRAGPASSSGAPAALAGVWMRRRYGPLGRVITTRWGTFFFSGLPLVRRERPAQALQELLAAAGEAGAAVMELAAIPAEGPVFAALKELAERQGLPLAVMARWRRAALDATMDPETWWRGDIPRKRRREWSRQRRRLGERGELRFERLTPDGEPGEWTEDFLALEARGWKGRAGTAIACDPDMRRFVAASLRAFHREGRLRFWRLRLNGATVATIFGFLADGELWLGKMAYDESLARFSPGVLLLVDVTRDILADPEIVRADSSAEPDHPMIDHIWRQRIAMADVMAAAPGTGRRRARALFALERARRRVRTWLKRLWLFLKSKKKRAA